MYVVGDTFLFETDDIVFGQDFAWWRGVIPGVRFTLEQFTHEGRYAWLRGPGYGNSGQYGNGAIHVACTELAKCSSHHPFLERTWDATEAPPHPLRQVVEL